MGDYEESEWMIDGKWITKEIMDGQRDWWMMDHITKEMTDDKINWLMMAVQVNDGCQWDWWMIDHTTKEMMNGLTDLQMKDDKGNYGQP